MKIRLKLKRLKEVLLYSVGMQIGVVLAITNLAFLLFVAYSQWEIQKTSSQYDEEINQYHRVLELKQDLIQGDNLFYDYIKTGDQALLEAYRAAISQADANLNALKVSAGTDDAAFLLASMKQSFSSYQLTYEQTVGFYERDNMYYYSSLTYGQEILGYIQKYSDDLLQDILQQTIENSVQAKKRQTVYRNLNLAAAMLISAMMLIFCFYIYRYVTVPLEELAGKAKELSRGNFNVHVTERGIRNDVGVLAHAFNTMAENVCRNVETEREKIEAERKYLEEQHKNMEYEKLLEEARFMALQTQTNPHFLFNTLNSISRTITFGRNEQAQQMLDSLAVLMRYNLADASVPVSIGQEMKLTGEYVNIQKIRFRERIMVEMRCEDEEAASALIPRFTLQPLVENSIVHGLEPKPEGGRMILDVKRVKQGVRLRICDNGTGIERLVLQQLKSGLLESKSRRIGIWNTCQRMVLFTGDKNSFRIMSKAGRGTMVILTVPWADAKEGVL